MVQLTRIDPADSTPLTFRVNQLLRSNPYLNGSNILFTARDGSVILRGTTHSYYQKQMAQEVIRSMRDVKSVSNQIEVATKY